MTSEAKIALYPPCSPYHSASTVIPVATVIRLHLSFGYTCHSCFYCHSDKGGISTK
ncbi:MULTISPECIES: hypothetical protein [unclassified Flavobacterium]|uniref:hypothetical protein n=1 Tax=unclassified Flavobacterium TaxID=196869 RepID=UPI0025C33FD9|nr:MULTISPECIES: hypothetical protein [unclassified Flavobacterium]